MTSKRNPLFIKVEKWLTNNPGKTIGDYRKLYPDTPPLKTRQRAGQPVQVSFKGQGTTDAITRRTQAIQANRPDVQVGIQAGKLWDELVGKKGQFTMKVDGKNKTFTSKEQYQNFEIKRHNNLTKLKIKTNRAAFKGSSHGHAVPPLHKFAIETYMQSFPEKGKGSGGNYRDQNKLPSDFDTRLKTAKVPTTKVAVAERHVGTASKIGNPTSDSVVKQILKSEKTIKSLPKEPMHLLKRFSNIKNLKLNLPKGGGGSLQRLETDVDMDQDLPVSAGGVLKHYKGIFDQPEIITTGGIFTGV